MYYYHSIQCRKHFLTEHCKVEDFITVQGKVECYTLGKRVYSMVEFFFTCSVTFCAMYKSCVPSGNTSGSTIGTKPFCNTENILQRTYPAETYNLMIPSVPRKYLVSINNRQTQVQQVREVFYKIYSFQCRDIVNMKMKLLERKP